MERQSSTSSDSSIKDGQGKMDGSEYVPARCRITKPSPPKPAKNPLQFVKIGPCELYRSAQEQIKKVEVIKKIKQDLRDDSQDWQSNLDSWKNNRRKRQEHIIERVVEIKNMELEQDKGRRRSKTFSEMMEERSSRRRKFNVLPTYTENDGNDLAELGISTSNRNISISDDSASEDTQNARYSSDEQCQSEKLNSTQDHTSTSHINKKSNDSINNNNENNINENRCDDENSPFTKSEYTYESAIQGYKTRVKKQSYQEQTSNDTKVHYGKDKNDRSSLCTLHTFNIHTSELSSSSPALSSKADLPKIDISKRKQLFEMGETDKKSSKVIENLPGELSHSSSIKDRLKDLEKYTEESMKIKKAARRLSGDIMTVRERLSGLVAQNSDDSKSNYDISAWASAGELRRPIDVCDRVIEVNIEEKERINNSQVNHHPSTSKLENENNRIDSNQFKRPTQIEGSRVNNLRHDKKNSRIDENLTESLRVSLSKLDNTNKVNNNSVLTCTKNNLENVSNDLFSPMYEKGRVFHFSLDNLHMHENGTGQCNLEHVQSLDGLDYCSQNYPPSGSSTELLALSQCGDTDREDSGIQTADVSCSVSQADEPDDDTDMLTTINNTHVDQHNPINTNGLEDGQHDLPVQTYLSSIELQPYDNKSSESTYDSHKSSESTYDSHKSSESTYDTHKSSESKYDSCKSSESLYDSQKSQEPPYEKSDLVQKSKEDTEKKNSNENLPSNVESTVDKNIILPMTENVEIQNKILFGHPTMVLYNSRADSIPDPLAPPRSMEPPKEKPPPPPIDIPSDDELSKCESQSEFKRLNSTKRIKNDLRNKRSSFLGIEGLPNDYLDQELILIKPPDANIILQEELQLEKQMYRRSQSYHLTESCPSVDLESRDSGVELELRSDNTSDLEKLGNSDYDKSSQKLVEPFEEDEISKKEREIIENLEKEEQWRHNYSQSKNSYPHKVLSKNGSKTFNNDNFINNSGQKSHNFVDKNIVRSSTTSSFTDDEHSEDVLRVERELLQLEQEELERQREDYLIQNSKTINQNNSAIKPGHSLQDISANTDNRVIRNKSEIYNNYQNYYQSTPDLQLGTSTVTKRPIPPVKSTRLEEINYNPNQMSKHTLHALSAAPRSRLMTTDSWIQPQVKKSSSAATLTPSLHECQNYNNHWLIQEAEQRRLSEQRPLRSTVTVLNGHSGNLQPMHEQHIPDSVVQTLTQRLQNRLTTREKNNILNRNEKTMNQDRLGGFSGPSLIDSMCNQPNHNPSSCSNQIPVSSLQTPSHTNSSGPMLSVSGRKKCSHCGDELGRGAAMIIESLCLFYHMDCFKCCVCHVQLGDGRMGTDVRVRNHKLHCHNCYSSDDGIKFSCV